MPDSFKGSINLEFKGEANLSERSASLCTDQARAQVEPLAENKETSEEYSSSSEEETEDEDGLKMTTAADLKFIRTFAKLKGADIDEIQSDQEESNDEETSKIDSEYLLKNASKSEKEREGILNVWKNPKSSDEKFLMDYVLKRGWVVSESQKKKLEKKSKKLVQKSIESEDDIEKADDFEFKYNMRYELAPSARQVPDSIRKKNETRKLARQRRNQRKKDARNQVIQEVKTNQIQSEDEDSQDLNRPNFKYRKVEPESFGLTLKEIMTLTDEELERRVPQSKLTSYNNRNYSELDRRRMFRLRMKTKLNKIKALLQKKQLRQAAKDKTKDLKFGYDRPLQVNVENAKIDPRRLAAYQIKPSKITGLKPRK